MLMDIHGIYIFIDQLGSINLTLHYMLMGVDKICIFIKVTEHSYAELKATLKYG